MATITTNTFLDGGTARTAGEAWTMNGGVLTIRTDTRVHANAPASMLGSIGATTISATLGGGVLIDGRNVRWMPYDTGTGTVPAIGTTITQGSVSGYLLGVWASLTSAPTAVGAAMPSTGFIKFREVTDGPYSAGALTGISASATGPDVTGWIEVVQDQAVANTVPRLGYFRTRGDWFYLDDTTGSAGQILQVPTNGGGAGTHVPAVWIETAPGSNVYEIYPAVEATYYLAANLSTDTRCKFVQTIGTGQVRIGRDGASANAGYVPPAGCRVRIPNVLGRQTSAANRALNLVPNATLSTRPDFTTTAAGEVDFEYFMNDWYHAFASPYKIRMVNVATFDTHNTSNEATPTELDNYVTGVYSSNANALLMTNNPLGGTIENCNFPRGSAASSGHSFSMTGCVGHEFTNVITGIIAYARNSGSFFITQCRDITFDNLTVYCETVSPGTCSNITFKNLTYMDRILGETIATTSKWAVQCTTSCDNIMVDGLSFGPVANNNPYAGVFNASNCSNLTFRNGGTLTTPLDCHATNGPAYLWGDSGNCDGVRIQRVYLENTRTNLIQTVNTSKNILLQNVLGSAGALQTLSVNTQLKGQRNTAGNSVTGGSSVYGTHWFDVFISDTAGRIWLAFNEPTAFSADQYQAVILGTGAGFTSAGQIVMPNVGDQIIWTMPYFVIGHTALANIAPTITGTNTGNFTFEYDIDTGSGFSGVYKTLNATNLSSETVSPTTGFKLKFRITVATANSGNALTYIRIDTVSTLVAQNGGLYPLDLTTLNLTGLQANSRVQLYDLTNATEIYNAVVSGTSLSYSTPYVDDFDCRVRVMKQNGVSAYEILEFTQSVGIEGFTRAVVQEVDVVYDLNGIDGSTVTGITIDDANLLVEVDTGTITWAAIYAYETYWLFTEEGIRDESRFIEAVDPANYKIYDFSIKNVSSPSAPLIITGGYGVDGDTGAALDIIDTSGGTIFCSPEHVVAYETSGGGGGGGASAADIWSYGSRSLTSGAAPSAASVASAVRTELATELGRVDVSISTRLAAGDYTAPDNSGISSIKNKTDNLPNDPADASDIATSFGTVNSTLTTVLSYIDTEVAAIKSKTDNLPSDPADASVVAGLIASVEAKVDAVDTVVDAIKVKTDALPSDPADQSLIMAAISGIPSAPSAATVASAVRTELSTELGRIDAAITTRMATFTYTAPDNASIAAILIDTNELQLNQGNWATATGFAVPGSAMTLTSGERSSVATAVEAALLNEGDSQQLIDAIVTAIGNTNMDEVALVSAIRLDLERAGGLLNNLPTLTEIETSSILAKKSDINALNNLSAAQVWASGMRTLTSGSNIILAKGVGVTGFNDISTAEVRAEVEAEVEDIRTNTNIIPALV